MASKILQANPDLTPLLQELEATFDSKVTHLAAMTGSGNRSFGATFKDQSVVVRLNRDTEHLGVDRKMERLILDAIKPLAIAPELILWRPDALVFAYVNVNSNGNANDKQNPNPNKLAAALRKLHTQEIPVELHKTPFWKPTDTIRDYALLAPEFQLMAEKQLAILDQYAWQDMEYGICHIDLNPENILVDENGNIALIDWEYGRVGPVAYDLAVYFETHKFGEEEEETFMSLYCEGAASDSFRSGVKQCRLAYQVIETLWNHIVGQATPS